MVRIFAAGDFHGDITTAKKLAQRALDEHADLIILNGDIVEEDNPHGIVYYFKKTGKPVMLVPGNHDFFATDFLSAHYDVPNLHGKHTMQGGVHIVGCGGANVGLMQLSEEEIYDTIKDAMPTREGPLLLVSHVHPANSRMEQFSSFIKGSIGLRAAIERFKPDVVVCGHVHEAEGIEEKIGDTTIINVGKRGKLIEL